MAGVGDDEAVASSGGAGMPLALCQRFAYFSIAICRTSRFNSEWVPEGHVAVRKAFEALLSTACAARWSVMWHPQDV